MGKTGAALGIRQTSHHLGDGVLLEALAELKAEQKKGPASQGLFVLSSAVASLGEGEKNYFLPFFLPLPSSAGAAAATITSSATGSTGVATTGFGLPWVTTLMPAGSFRSFTCTE